MAESNVEVSVKVPLTFTGTDLSADCRTQWVPKPEWARYMAIGIGWTAASAAPTGTLSWEGTTSKTASSGAKTTITGGPAGSAASILVDLIKTASPYVAVSYVAGSGGTDESWTDDTGVAGTTPNIRWLR